MSKPPPTLPNKEKIMATITIGNKQYSGNNVSIVNGRITIDGDEKADTVTGVTEIRIIEGVLESLITDASVSCGDVKGNITAWGSVNCDNVWGSINCEGSVTCDNVKGNINAGDSVRYG